MLTLRLGALATLLTLATAVAAAPADPDRLDARLATALAADPAAEHPLLVFLAEQVDLSRYDAGRRSAGAMIRTLQETAARTQAPVLATLAADGRAVREPLWITNAIGVRGDAALVGWLLARPEVGRIVSCPPIRPAGEPGGPATRIAPWNIQRVGANAVWDEFGLDGSGLVVGSLDSGVDVDHPALAGKWRGGDNSWIDIIYGEPEPYDDSGHGTHTIGTMVGGDGPGPFLWDIGVAPGAQFIAAKIFRTDGGFDDLYQAYLGAQWMLDPDDDPDTDDFPCAVNNSWVIGYEDSSFRPAVLAWRQAGIVPVFSAGNDGPAPETTRSPGNYEISLCVGGTTTEEVVWVSASRGPSPENWPYPPDRRKPEISAPSADVTSCLPGGLYGAWYGTSMAAPHVAGAVALLLQADPSLDYDHLRELLLTTAVDLEAPGYDYDVGYGRLDIHAAVAAALGATAAPASESVGRAWLGAWPNPSHGEVRLEWAGLPAGTADATVEIFDVRGRRVAALDAGPHSRNLRWNGTDAEGRALPAGVYLARVSSGAERATRRILRVR